MIAGVLAMWSEDCSEFPGASAIEGAASSGLAMAVRRPANFQREGGGGGGRKFRSLARRGMDSASENFNVKAFAHG